MLRMHSQNPYHILTPSQIPRLWFSPGHQNCLPEKFPLSLIMARNSS